jgi:hypothetical protein
MLYRTNLNRTCWICGNDVQPKDGKNDEIGNPVHEPCLAIRAALASEAILSAKKPPSRTSANQAFKRVLGSD